MAISDTINSIKEHLGEAYEALEEKQATIPENKNIENLADSILSIEGGGEPSEYNAIVNPELTSDNIEVVYNGGKASTTRPLTAYAYIKEFPKIILDKTKFKSTTMATFFQNLSTIEKLDLSNCDFENIIEAYSMFTNCFLLKEIKFADNAFKSLIDFSSAFYKCYSLEKIDLSNKILSTITSCNSTFRQCYSAYEIKLDNVKIKASSLTSLFYDCRNVKKLNLTSFDTSNTTNMSTTFTSTFLLCELDISTFDFSKVTSFSSIFKDCGTKSLQSEGAYADGIPYVYVKDTTAQQWILNLGTSNRPARWSTANVIVAGSTQDLRNK